MEFFQWCIQPWYPPTDRPPSLILRWDCVFSSSGSGLVWWPSSIQVDDCSPTRHAHRHIYNPPKEKKGEIDRWKKNRRREGIDRGMEKERWWNRCIPCLCVVGGTKLLSVLFSNAVTFCDIFLFLFLLSRQLLPFYMKRVISILFFCCCSSL